MCFMREIYVGAAEFTAMMRISRFAVIAGLIVFMAGIARGSDE